MSASFNLINTAKKKIGENQMKQNYFLSDFVNEIKISLVDKHFE